MTDEPIDGEAELESDEPAKPRAPRVRRKPARDRPGTAGKGKGQRAGAFGRNAPGHPRVLAAKKRATAALESRLEHKPWREVARIHNYASGGSAHDAVMTLVRAEPVSSREEFRAIMDMEIDRTLAELWPRFKDGDLEAGRLILRCFDRRAKLLGLDAITDADYVAISSVQGLLGAIFDAALRLLPAESHAAFLEDANRTLALLDPGPRA